MSPGRETCQPHCAQAPSTHSPAHTGYTALATVSGSSSTVWCLCVPQGELTITTDMEDLSTALFYDTVPNTWVARAYPSMMGLAAWYADLLLRVRVRMAPVGRGRGPGGAIPTAVHSHPRSVAPERSPSPAYLAFLRAEPEATSCLRTQALREEKNRAVRLPCPHVRPLPEPKITPTGTSGS